VKRLEDLALFGGAPAFAEPLHVGKPNVGDRKRLMERFDEILDRRWFTNDGPFVREFEKRIAEKVGVRNVVAMCNGTIALEIAARALGMKDEVIVPAYTFVATAHSLQWQEIEPVFADVRPDTHAIDPARVEELITPRTTGIIGVHLWGRGCDPGDLEQIARRRGLKLLLDASHAFGCSYRGRMIGGFGHAEVFSFHATKFASSFEGGAIATDDDDLAEKARLMRNFGFVGKDKVVYLGINGKMTEVCAAMGVTSIEAADEIIAANKAHYLRYKARLSKVPGLKVIDYPESERANYHYVIVEVDDAAAGCSRDVVVRALEAENVLARRYFTPGVHGMEPYRSYQPLAGLVLPVTKRLAETVMSLPTGPTLSTGDVDLVCGLVETICANGPAVAKRLAGA
jgi:dTDP-4-amino-4,6-dideoxygalactose transaminase